jgi:hypothetical protein
MTLMAQPARELVASKRKHMRVNGSKFASFYFLLFPRIGTFQRVASEKNRKILTASQLARKLLSLTISNSRGLSAPGRPARGFRQYEHLDRISDSVKQKLESYSDACWLVCPRSVSDVMAVPGSNPGIDAAIRENAVASI